MRRKKKSCMLEMYEVLLKEIGKDDNSYLSVYGHETTIETYRNPTLIMKDVIRLLPDSVANQIAAGEVIQQPASVVKELVENAVDAGADRIDVVIGDAGRTLIQVIDNGCGMSPTDARLAFERHSTSKIREAADLFKLTTMGFRGEALASIAAVSQLDVRTMPQGETIGTRLRINGSVVEEQSAEVTSPGTNFMVRNIFFNVPARRKFLKKDSVEFSYILREFERLALVNPEVEMSLTSDGRLVHKLNRSNLKIRIGELFGRSVEDNLVPVNSSTDLVKISGYIGNPGSARKRGALQYFFVNGRNMKHPYFRKALLSCFEGLIPSDSQPNFFIGFEIDPSTIDVNIHPTKNEIKFEEEAAVWQILTATVREALGKFNLGPSIDFENPLPAELTPAAGAVSSSISLPATTPPDSAYNPFLRLQAVDFRSYENERKKLLNWESAYAENLYRLEPGTESALQAQASPEFLQVAGKYVLMTNKNGLLLIDQHRAHITVLYAEYLQKFNDDSLTGQQLLFTSTLELDPARSIVLENILEIIEKAGFKVQRNTKDVWEITSVPAVLRQSDGTEILMDIIDSVSEETKGSIDALDKLKEIICRSMALAQAVSYGQTLSLSEMEHLVSSLFSLRAPQYDPKGRKTMSEIPESELEALFLRNK